MNPAPTGVWSRLHMRVAGLKRSEIARRLSSGIFWMTSAAIAGKSLSLVSSIVLARLLGRQGLGEFGVVFSTVSLFETFASFGLGGAATKYVAEYRVNSPSDAAAVIKLTVRAGVLTGACFSMALMMSASWLSENALAAAHLSGLIQISSLALFFVALDGIQVGILSGLESFKSIAVVTFIQGVLYILFVVIGTLTAGLIGAVWGLCVSMAAKCMVNGVALRMNGEYRRIMTSGASPRSHWSVLWNYSLPMVLIGILVSPAAWVCNAILVNQPGGYGQMGLLSAALSWQTAVVFLPTSISRTTLPILSELYGKKDFESFRKVLKVKMALTGGIAVLMAVPLIALSRYVMALYGAEFASGWLILITVCLTGIVTSALMPIGLAIQSLGRLWMGSVFNFVWAVMMIGLCLILTPMVGALGLALSILIAYVCLFVMSALFVVNCLR